MVKIEHIAAILERMDNWTDYDEAQIRRLLGGNHIEVGRDKLIDGLYPGHTHRISHSGKGVFVEFELSG